MNKQDLIDIYRRNPLVKTLANKSLNSKKIYIDGIKGSLFSFVSVAVNAINSGNDIIIVNSEVEAKKIYSDISNITGKNVYYLPCIYDKNNEVDEYKLILRTQIVSHLRTKNYSSIIITYPESLCAEIESEKVISDNEIIILKNSNLNVTLFKNTITKKNFIKKDFVSNPGEFSIRGGIIDIFSYNYERPFRIELNGNLVESIREFDLDTQLSNKELTKITIVNNLINDKIPKQNLFSFVPNNSRLWILNKTYLLSKIESLKDHNYINIKSYEDLENYSKNVNKIILNNIKKIDKSNLIPFNSSSQVQYNMNYHLLLNDIENFYQNNYQIILCSQSVTHIKKNNEISYAENKFNLQLVHLNISKGFIDHFSKVVLFTDYQILNTYFRPKLLFNKSKGKQLNLKQDLKIGDFVVHVDHGIGKFVGVAKINNNEKTQEVIRIVYKNNDTLYLNVHNIHKIVKYNSVESSAPNLDRLGSANWSNKKKKIKNKIKEIAIDLISLYSKRKKQPGFAFKKDDSMQIAMESAFIYEDTLDQSKATKEIKKDMEEPHPMDRLICGDVGFGKTELAIRAAFKCVNNQKQVAVLVPTTVLAMQHYKSFKERLETFPVTIKSISRFTTSKDKKIIYQNLLEGKIDILIGTHALVNKKVIFKDLGLLIIDEEQKFGVLVKEKLKELKSNIDVLTMTATPIPRTLQFSLMGARDLSILTTPPKNRYPIKTFIRKFEKEVIEHAIKNELDRMGQIFFVNNRIYDINNLAVKISKIVPKAKIGIIHGRMESRALEKEMVKFIEKKYDILISTSIIESGLDIPNANTIIINNAHTFGLSDLHQMRGRVGRSTKEAYCYLLVPSYDQIPSEAQKRLYAIEELSELGDGFKVSMRDLDIRGSGNLLGGEQSGFIADIGFEMYQRILNETITEIKKSTFKDLFNNTEIKDSAKECHIDTDLDISIPEDYVTSQSERINLYMQLDKLQNEESLKKFTCNTQDRFGKIPKKFEILLSVVRLRWIAKSMEIEKITLKNNIMKCYFSTEIKNIKESIVQNILQTVNKDPKEFAINENEKNIILTKKNARSLTDIHSLLSKFIITKV